MKGLGMNLIERAAPFVGEVNMANLKEVLGKVEKMYKDNSSEPIVVPIISAGGSTGVAFAFYDFVLASGIQLHTIASGYCDSAAVIILLAGEVRSVTQHTTMQLHESRRNFGESTRLSLKELQACQYESEIYNEFYARILVERTKINLDDAHRLLSAPHVLIPDEVIEKGFAHHILSKDI
jgi:ATP-dependent protease ClpP protease subunit